MDKVEGLALYQTQGCPYCVRVRHFLQQAGKSIELRDLRGDPEHFEELVAATGRRTVPCLRIETGPGEFEWLAVLRLDADVVRQRLEFGHVLDLVVLALAGAGQEQGERI